MEATKMVIEQSSHTEPEQTCEVRNEQTPLLVALPTKRTMLDEILDGLRPQILDRARGSVTEMVTKAFIVEGALDEEVEMRITKGVGAALAERLNEDSITDEVCNHINISEEDVAKMLAENMEVDAGAVAERIKIDEDEVTDAVAEGFDRDDITKQVAEKVVEEIDPEAVTEQVLEGMDTDELAEQASKAVAEMLDADQIAGDAACAIKDEVLAALRPMVERMVREAVGLKADK